VRIIIILQENKKAVPSQEETALIASWWPFESLRDHDDVFCDPDDLFCGP